MRSTSGSSAAALMIAGLRGRPTRPVDREPVLGHHVDRRHGLAFFSGERAVRHRGEPDVGVEADLVGGVAGQHRAAARLGNVADQNAVPDAFGLRLAREALEEGDHRRISPHAIARQAHDLPGLAVDGERLGSGKTAARVEADRARLGFDGRQRSPEHFLGRQPRVGGIGERGQRFGVQRSLVLCGRGQAPGESSRQYDADRYESYGHWSPIRDRAATQRRRAEYGA